MYLVSAKRKLEEQLEKEKYTGKDTWATEYDIKCLDDTIDYLDI